MKASELRTKNDEELRKELQELLRAQFGLRMQLATQQLGNTSLPHRRPTTSRRC